MDGWVHPQRDRRVLFEREADRYDRTRPSYPAAMVDAALGPDPGGLAVLDIGCGTGIASRLFAERGTRVLGVELNPAMAAIAEQRGIAVEVAPFETWDPAGRSFDRVTCAQAWHWLDHQVSVPKAADLLRPGGRLCLIWSIGNHPEPLGAALEDAYRRAGAPQLTIGYGGDRATDPDLPVTMAADGLRRSGRFADPEVRWFPWTRAYTRDMWLDEILSHSDHIALPPEQQQRVVAEVGAAIDAQGGGFEMPYRTVLVAAQPL